MKRKCFFVILFLVLAIFLSGCSGVTTPPITTNQSPTASFTANPASGIAPLVVSFNASNSSDSDGSIVSYAWDFKDGNTGNGKTLNHTFSSTGSYNVELTVTDNEGATDSATKTITVTDPITTPGDFNICENLLRGLFTALSNRNFTQALSYCKSGGITYEFVMGEWDLAQEYPTLYATYQVYDVYNFSYLGNFIFCDSYYSWTGHDIYGVTYDTYYEYGSVVFEKINGEWKMS